MLQSNIGWAEKSLPKYEVIVYCGAEDPAFVTEVPELPGCAADSKTYQEAVGNVVIVIQEWIDTAKKLGRSIPVPRAASCSREPKIVLPQT